MTTETIVAKQVWAPKEGKKFGSVVTPDKTRYMGTASILSGIKKDSTIVVDLESQKWGEDTVQVIKRVVQAVPNTPTPASSQSASEDIFVTGVVGRAMGSGQFAVTDIKLLTLAAVQAYRDWKHPTPPEPRTVSPQPANPGDDLRYAEQF